MLKPTLIGGALFGFVGGLPVLGALNCACCSLVIGGGFLAAYLYSKDCAAVGAEFGPGKGALVGLVAGLFYSVVNAIVSAIVNIVTGQSIEKIIEQVEAAGGQIPPEAEPFIESMLEAGPLTLAVAGFFIVLLFAVIFSTLGGVIGGAAFKVQPAPPAAPPTGGGMPPAPPIGGGMPPAPPAVE